MDSEDRTLYVLKMALVTLMLVTPGVISCMVK